MYPTNNQKKKSLLR